MLIHWPLYLRDPGPEGGGSPGTVFRPVAHQGRVLDVRRLELSRQGKLPGPQGEVLAAGTIRGSGNLNQGCALQS